MSHPEFVAFGLAWNCGLVVLVSWFLFNRPGWARTYTTRGAYERTAAAHALAFVVLFLLSFLVATWVSIDLGLLTDPRLAPPPGIAPDPLPLDDRALTVPRWIALAVTGIVLAMPPVERRLRSQLQRLAGVPEVAHHFARELSEAPFTVPEARQHEVRAMLLHRDIDVEADWLPLARPLYQNLERAAALYLLLRRLFDEGRYRRVFTEARFEYTALRQRFDRTLLQTARALARIDRTGELRVLCAPVEHGDMDTAGSAPGDALAGGPEADALMRTIVSAQIADTCEDISLFHREVCLLVARAVISGERGPARRAAVFGRLGFQLPPETAPRGYQALLLGAGWILLFVVIFFAAVHGPQRVLPPWAMVVVITLTQVGGLAAAIVPKMHFAFASAGLRDRTPWPFLVVAGSLALAWTIALNVLAGGIAHGLLGVEQRLQEVLPFLPASAVTAVACAWLVQDHRWRGVASAARGRWLDAAVMGGAWLVVTLAGQGATVLLHDTALPVATLALYALYSVAMGGAIGYLVPHLARFGADRLLRPDELSAATPARAISQAAQTTPPGAWPLAASTHPRH